MLTDRFIRNAKPGTYADAEGLYLRVLAASKVFVWRRRVQGKDTWTTLGHYPEMSLLEARELLEKRKSGKASYPVAEAFKAYYQYLEREFVDPIQVHRMFKKDVLPHLNGLALDEVDRAGWVSLIQRVVKRGSPVMANRLLTQVKKFLDYAEQQGWIDENPLEKVKRRAVGGKEKPKDRNLDWPEIESFLALLASDSNRMSPGTRWALLGCLMTGQRASEVLTMDAGGRTFTKMQRYHQVPMTRTVSLWMKHRPEELPKDHRVLSHALRRLGLDFTPHDLRRTYASRLADLQVAPHVVEKLLDHKMIGVMAVYNRAEYRAERLAAQKLWDKELTKRRPRR
ncbi:MAG: integrase family protein [Azovibrio sp.]|uniref:tyrosine-type recombinase/integrase n=1 Tax=Azovibrio sp. TaxID=1872673 RepID=UPI003C75368A